MRPVDRWLVGVGLVLLDAVVFVVPLTGLLAAYVVIARPPWFRQLVDRLYDAG